MKSINPNAGEEIGRTIGKIRCHEWLGGMLRYYYRAKDDGVFGTDRRMWIVR